jgi:hypothetical protein
MFADISLGGEVSPSGLLLQLLLISGADVPRRSLNDFASKPVASAPLNFAFNIISGIFQLLPLAPMVQAISGL